MTTITVTRDATTLTLTDASGGYNMLRQSWKPNVGRLSNSRVAGLPVYDDVLESIQIEITGTTTTQVLDRYQALVNIFDGAEQWKYDVNDNVVNINYTPTGAAETSTAVITGVPDNFITVPDEFELMAGNIYRLHPVTVRFYRRAQWHYDTETASSGSVECPAAMAITGLTNTTRIRPAKVEVNLTGVDDAGALAPYYQGHMALSWSGDYGRLFDGWSTMTGWTLGNTTVSWAYNNRITYFRPSSSTTGNTGKQTLTSWSANGDSKVSVGAVMNCRNASSTITYRVKLVFNAGQTSQFETRWISFPAGENDALSVAFGAVTSPTTDITTYDIYIDASSTSSSSAHQFEIEVLGIFAVNSFSRIIAFDKFGQYNTANKLTVDAAVDTEYRAQVYTRKVAAGTNHNECFRGDAYLVGQSGTTLDVRLFGVTIANNGTGDVEWGIVTGDVTAATPTADTSVEADVTIYETSLTPKG